jgi:hypothetical protein
MHSDTPLVKQSWKVIFYQIIGQGYRTYQAIEDKTYPQS